MQANSYYSLPLDIENKIREILKAQVAPLIENFLYTVNESEPIDFHLSWFTGRAEVDSADFVVPVNH